MANMFLVQMQLKCSLSVEVSLIPLGYERFSFNRHGFLRWLSKSNGTTPVLIQSAEVTAKIDREKFSSIEIDVIILVKNACR